MRCPIAALWARDLIKSGERSFALARRCDVDRSPRPCGWETLTTPREWQLWHGDVLGENHVQARPGNGDPSARTTPTNKCGRSNVLPTDSSFATIDSGVNDQSMRQQTLAYDARHRKSGRCLAAELAEWAGTRRRRLQQLTLRFELLSHRRMRGMPHTDLRDALLCHLGQAPCLRLKAAERAPAPIKQPLHGSALLRTSSNTPRWPRNAI